MRGSLYFALAFVTACSVPDFFLVDAGGGGGDDGGRDGSVDARSDATIDAPPGSATVTGVSSTTANGYYKSAAAISIQVTFDQAVTVDITGGTPRLALNTGANADYASGTGTTTLTFSYTVAAGQSSADLDYVNTSSLTLNGGTIKNGTNNAFLSLPGAGAAGSLGANKALVIDAVLPTIGTITGTGAYSSSSTATLSFTVTDANLMTTNCSLSGGTGTMTGCSATGVTFTSLTEGSHTVTITHTDAAGNTSAPQAITWTSDTVLPIVSTISGVGTYSSSASATLSFSVNETNQGTTNCSITGTATQGTCNSSGVTYTGLGEGSHTATITHTDLATNTSTAKTITWTVDLTNPVVSTITGVTSGGYEPSVSATLSYTITETNQGTTTCTVDGTTVNVTACTLTGATLSGLNEGAHTMTVTHMDLAGRTGSRQISWTVDTIAPVVSTITGIPNAPNLWTSSPNVTLSYSVTDANLGATTCVQDIGTGTETSCTNTAATYTGLSVGTHTITIRHTDRAGNPGANTITFSFCPMTQFLTGSTNPYPFTTPAGCGNKMEVWMWGAGAAGSTSGAAGGGGGFAYGQLTIASSGFTYSVYVGGGGNRATGGANGGGQGGVNGATGAHGGGGGGASYMSGSGIIIWVGGGGGGGDCSANAPGGGGGGLSGVSGSPAANGGGGSSTSTQGLGGGNGSFGVFARGGDGGPGTCGGGGGGGGQNGGGGGGGGTTSQAGGGGGAGDFVSAADFINIQHATANGAQPAAITDSHYLSGHATGGGTGPNSVGGDGMVLIHVHP